MLVTRTRWRIPPIWLPFAVFVAGNAAFAGADRALSTGLAANPEILRLRDAVSGGQRVPHRRADSIPGRVLCACAAALSAAWALNQFYNKYEDAMDAHQDFYRAYVADRITGFMSHWMTFSEQMMMVLLVIGAVVFFSTDRRWIGWLIGAGALISVALIAGGNTQRVAGDGRRRRVSYLVLEALAAARAARGGRHRAAGESVRDGRSGHVRLPPATAISIRTRIARCAGAIGYQMIKAHPWLGIGPEQVAVAISELSAAGHAASAADGLLRSSAQHLYSLRGGAGDSGDARHDVDAACVRCSISLAACCDAPPGSPTELGAARRASRRSSRFWWADFTRKISDDSEVLAMFLAVIGCGYVASIHEEEK